CVFAPLREKTLSLLCVVVLLTTHVAAQTASITVDARKVENRISPLLYGQFLEFMFEGIKGGLHAELIRNRSFEEAPNVIGLSRNWERYPDDRNDDYALSFAWDDQSAYPSNRKEHSLRVKAGDGVIPRHGVYQPRVPVRAGVEYRGYIWLKTEDYDGRVTVALESDVKLGEVYAAADISINKGDWRKYEFTLRPTRNDPLARFAILFPGKGTVWIDQVSLMPGDAAPGGVRRDVFEKVKLLKPAFIRWPGGNVAQDYHWSWGVGPRDQRVTWSNLSWKNEPEPSDFGTDEFVAFARAAGTEPSITVNVEGRDATVEEAAAWVEYCNGPATSKYGAMRAANGHAAPFGVKFWEVGNEIWGDWVRGHSDAETYARNYNRYAKAMRAVDPSIKLIAVGDNNMNWNRTVLRAVGEHIDYLAIHHYYGRHEAGNDLSKLFARPLFFERFYKDVAQLLRELKLDGRVKLAINEWGLDLPLERQYSIESAIYGARLMNVFERSGDLVEMSAVSDLVNGWPGGIIQASRHDVFITPLYLVNQIYNEHRGDVRLSTTVNTPDVDATASRRGNTIFIKAVNTNLTSSFVTTITVEGVAPGTRAEIKTIAGRAATVQSKSIPAGRRFTTTLPNQSVSVIT
ncbi:MAG TPA: alpha-L-arabinofuranosidase C-terminal domain-containing protein, partial [Pyrinomonadaceae bacterium]|nr:alpha-L-arabinofuranosidase C-terminal domain-containing protein [Pyrinomonadaceae bacterium]